MTERERKQIIRAIRLIHQENRYEDGMDILCGLVGLRRWTELLGGAEDAVPITQVAKGPDRPFSVRWPKTARRKG